VEICRLGADSSPSVTITGTPDFDVEAMAQFVCVQSVEYIPLPFKFTTCAFHVDGIPEKN
jgi:hypothetical protein